MLNVGYPQEARFPSVCFENSFNSASERFPPLCCPHAATAYLDSPGRDQPVENKSYS